MKKLTLSHKREWTDCDHYYHLIWEKKEIIKLDSHISIDQIVCLYISLFVGLSVGLSVGVSVCLIVCLSVRLCLSVCLSLILSVSYSVWLTVCQSVSQSLCQSVCQSVCLSVCQSVSQSACLSVYLFVYRSLCQCVPRMLLSISSSKRNGTRIFHCFWDKPSFPRFQLVAKIACVAAV